MSYLITVVLANGIVMASDSAASIADPVDRAKDRSFSYSYNKLFLMKNNIGIASGNDIVTSNGTIIDPYIEYFISNNTFSGPRAAADMLLEYIKSIDPNIDAKYHVCGFEPAQPFQKPAAFFVKVCKGEITQLNKPGEGGIMYCGGSKYFSLFVPGIMQNIGYYSMQDAIDLCLFAIDMNTKLQRFIDMNVTIGGPIDILTIQPGGAEWIQRKTLVGGAR